MRPNLKAMITDAGTVLLAKLSPANLTKIGSQILFTAYCLASGDELWSFGEADCGNTPDPTFPTLLASGGACHRVDPSVISPILGSARDIDPDGQPTDTADGYDLAAIDDEDGVNTFTSMIPHHTHYTIWGCQCRLK